MWIVFNFIKFLLFPMLSRFHKVFLSIFNKRSPILIAPTFSIYSPYTVATVYEKLGIPVGTEEELLKVLTKNPTGYIEFCQKVLNNGGLRDEATVWCLRYLRNLCPEFYQLDELIVKQWRCTQLIEDTGLSIEEYQWLYDKIDKITDELVRRSTEVLGTINLEEGVSSTDSWNSSSEYMVTSSSSTENIVSSSSSSDDVNPEPINPVEAEPINPESGLLENIWSWLVDPGAGVVGIPPGGIILGIIGVCVVIKGGWELYKYYQTPVDPVELDPMISSSNNMLDPAVIEKIETFVTENSEIITEVIEKLNS